MNDGKHAAALNEVKGIALSRQSGAYTTDKALGLAVDAIKRYRIIEGSRVALGTVEVRSALATAAIAAAGREAVIGAVSPKMADPMDRVPGIESSISRTTSILAGLHADAIDRPDYEDRLQQQTDRLAAAVRESKQRREAKSASLVARCEAGDLESIVDLEDKTKQIFAVVDGKTKQLVPDLSPATRQSRANDVALAETIGLMR